MIKSNKIEVIEVKSVKLNPKNRNKHSKEQIDRLAKIIEYQGFRSPIIISNQSGLCVAGEGRILAARQLGLEDIPAIYQDFDDEEQELAFGISHNAIHNWSELDLSGINADLENLGPEFALDLLGIKDFILEPADFNAGTEDEQGKLDELKELITQCPNCGECFDANKNRPKT